MSSQNFERFVMTKNDNMCQNKAFLVVKQRVFLMNDKIISLLCCYKEFFCCRMVFFSCIIALDFCFNKMWSVTRILSH